MKIKRFLPIAVVTFTAVAAQAEVRHPTDFFGFEIGSDGELARYPRVLEYLKHLASESDRVEYEELGRSTDGQPYAIVRFSSPANLARMDELIEINERLSDPRETSASDARKLARDGRPFYLLFSSIHSTEVGNGQAINVIAHRLATGHSPEIQHILDNVVLLMIPAQNPDGQIMVIDHWYETAGTDLERRYPDLYQRYVGHDDNRDWFMFTQVETRLAVEVQNRYRPQLSHDMHQMGSSGARIFVPPFKDPYDPNIHPLLITAQARVGLAMADALLGRGLTGVTWNTQYDLWTPARQYMLYRGQPRILTEIASADIADPHTNPRGVGVPLGPQETRWNFPTRYDSDRWTLSQIVEYGTTAVFAGLREMANDPETWLGNFYRVHRDVVERDSPPFAFLIPERQRDPFEAYELLQILQRAQVEIHAATRGFQIGDTRVEKGDRIVRLDQPYGLFAKTMLERQEYPDLRFFPGGPPIPPYDVTAQTLGLLMGVDVAPIDARLAEDVPLALLGSVSPARVALPEKPEWAYLVPPESNALFLAIARLQAANIPVFRSSSSFEASARGYAPGTVMVPPTGEAREVLAAVSRETGLPVGASDRAPAGVAGWELEAGTRIGLFKVANNMPAGWLMWLMEQYELQHRIIESTDFEAPLEDRYDTIVLPSGTSRRAMIEGLSPELHSEKWRWAYGIGDEGTAKLADWVRGGGTLVAIGSAVETARVLLDLPIAPLLPDPPRRRRGGPPSSPEQPTLTESESKQALKSAFQSPARLEALIRDEIVEPTAVFFCPGSLLKQHYDVTHPLAYGMPEAWPTFFRFDQAYRIRPGFEIASSVASRYPDTDDLVASGWLLGAEKLRDQAGAIAFEVGRGRVYALPAQIEFRTQTRATFKLLFNAIFQGPAEEVDAASLAALR